MKITTVVFLFLLFSSAHVVAEDSVDGNVGATRSVIVFLSSPKDGSAEVISKAEECTDIIFFQSPDRNKVKEICDVAYERKLLGKYLFVSRNDFSRIDLADNYAKEVILGEAAAGKVDEKEVLRVLHPEGKALVKGKTIIKKPPPGCTSWSYPNNGADNNRFSLDENVSYPYKKQFIAFPKFGDWPTVSASAGGRVFIKFGHIAKNESKSSLVDTLVAFNGYNGLMIWKKKLQEGFLHQRNTMIATKDVLYTAGAGSCRLLNSRDGSLIREIFIPNPGKNGNVWKWMALSDKASQKTIYALVGGEEAKTQSSKPIEREETPPNGWSFNVGDAKWTGIWSTLDYREGEKNHAFGHTFVALDALTGEIEWSYKSESLIDGRSVCMRNGKVFFYCPNKSLACLDAEQGALVWEKSSRDFIDKIEPLQYMIKSPSLSYLLCSDDYLVISGFQYSGIIVLSTHTGELLWSKESLVPDVNAKATKEKFKENSREYKRLGIIATRKNYSVVLHKDAMYAIFSGPTQIRSLPIAGYKLDYKTGNILETFPERVNCGQVSSSLDSVFFRGAGGSTARINVPDNSYDIINPMRPPCIGGVMMSDAMLYWTPTWCGCSSLYGFIGMSSASTETLKVKRKELKCFPRRTDAFVDIKSDKNDWISYGGDSARSCRTDISLPSKPSLKWEMTAANSWPTATVVAGDFIFGADRAGCVYAANKKTKTIVWRRYTGAPIYYAPEFWNGRIYVGGGDGYVYSFDASNGNPIWRFRCAPVDQRINVFDKLISSWPLSGGIVLQDGVVYAAAGVAQTDGIYVYTLDAETGERKSKKEYKDSGMQLNGNLSLHNDTLAFKDSRSTTPGLRKSVGKSKTLEMASDILNQYVCGSISISEYRNLEYGGKEGLRLVEAVKQKNKTRFSVGAKGKVVWEADSMLVNGIVIGRETVLIAGTLNSKKHKGTAELMSYSLKDGSVLQRVPLPAPAVKYGISVSAAAEVFVSLQDGRTLCFQ